MTGEGVESNYLSPFQHGTLWVALVLVAAGAIVCVVGLQEPTGKRPLSRPPASPAR